MIRSVIDLGTNSLKCVVASVEQSAYRILADSSKVTRLGGTLQKTGCIGIAAMQSNLSSLKDIARMSQAMGADYVLCVGCATLRRAADADDFRKLVLDELGWQLRTISEEEEAHLTYTASASLAAQGLPCAVIDIGGGSTEVVFGRASTILYGVSLPQGAVTLTSRFDLTGFNASGILEARHFICGLLAKLARPQGETMAVACGGSATSLASVHLGLAAYTPEQLQGTALTHSELQRQIELYASSSLEARKQIVGLDPDRADIILSGAIILQEILMHFGWEQVFVSTRGIRHALLLDESYWGESI